MRTNEMVLSQARVNYDDACRAEMELWKSAKRSPLWALMVLSLFSFFISIPWVHLLVIFGTFSFLPLVRLYVVQKSRKMGEKWLRVLEWEIENGRGNEEFDYKKLEILVANLPPTEHS